jgi:cysteine-rich repeat protein
MNKTAIVCFSTGPAISGWLLRARSRIFAEVQRSRGKVPFAAGIVLVGLFSGRADARVCEVSMHADSAVTLGALQLDLDFSGTSGFVPAQGTKPVCKGDVADTLTMFGIEGSVVTVSVLSLAGFSTPAPIAHCTFEDATGTTDAKDFELVVTDATDIEGEAVAAPRVSVEYGPCDDDTTTTTTSTTTTSTSTTTSTTTSTSTSTTTLPDDCGNGIVDGEEDCDDGNDDDGDGCDSGCIGIVCGDANGNDTVQSSDALLVLRAAIGQAIACPVEVCDADGDEVLRASDSLRVLRRAVGQSVVMVCGAG